MLPLWIIDLREKTDRRDHFIDLVGQLDHVDVPNVDLGTDDSVEPPTPGTAREQRSSEGSTKISVNANLTAGLETRDGTVKEAIEAEYRERAARQAILKGYYWRYSRMAERYHELENEALETLRDGSAIFDDNMAPEMDAAENETSEAVLSDLEGAADAAAKRSATIYYRFQEEIVKEGQAFIRRIRESNAKPHLKINIVVLGDITEKLTRVMFPSVAAIVEKEKGRMLASHIHQGAEIIGSLYIPSDINARHVNLRKSMRRTLMEIDMGHRAETMRGYDHVMLYQDVQNRAESSYGALNDKEIAEYLFQCMVNLYMACDEWHPLISGTASADTFYFSMGACSLFYDTENEDVKLRNKLVVNIMRALKSEGEGEKVNEELSILNDNDYDADSFITNKAREKLAEADIEEDEPSPHPIRNFLNKFLKRKYYGDYLRYYTRDMHRRIVDSIDRSTKSTLDEIASESRRRYNDARLHFFDSIRDNISFLTSNDGGIPAIRQLLKNLRETLSQRKSEVQNVLKRRFWNRISSQNGYFPREMEDKFMEYHDVFLADTRSQNGGNGQREMKGQAIDDLNGLLSREATMLSRICRSVLLGVMLALALVPVLALLSPQILNLGRVGRYSEWWSVGIFFLPVLIQFISYFRYMRKKKRAVDNLKAIYLHDAYARVANRIESEITNFYNKLIALGDRYEKRCDIIMQEVEKGFKGDVEGKGLVPETTFNQPLIGGEFGDLGLLPVTEIEDREVDISFIRYKMSEVHAPEYFMFIRNNSNMIAELFRGVNLCENLLRRVDPSGKEVLVSKDEQEKEQEQEWERLRAQFHVDLAELVERSIPTRLNDTVGEKIVQYCRNNTGTHYLLQPMIEYAASNGEFISSADPEFLDVKMNAAELDQQIIPLVAVQHPKFQADKFVKLYQKYLFITRWRSYEHLSFNRILPMEDFDEEVRNNLVSEWQGDATSENTAATDYESAVLLWALCGDEHSQDWAGMFLEDNEEDDKYSYTRALSDKEIYREILNQED